MTIPLYSRVRLTTDRYESEGARKGMLGYVIEAYPGEKYEIEFSDQGDGTTLAQVVVSADEVELCPEP